MISFFLLINILPFSAVAQHCHDNFLGTKALYTSPDQKYTPAPVGYAPVFIDHVGRHGARHLTKDVKTTQAYRLLLKADSINELSAKGKQLKQMVIALLKIEKGNTKFISAEGRDELRGLGERMYLNYPTVFHKNLSISVATTKEIRTKQSADAFLEGLNSKLKDTAPAKFYNDDSALRFYDLSPAYKTFENKVDSSTIMLGFEKTNGFATLNKAVVNRIFTARFVQDLSQEQQAKFVADVFGFVAIVYSLNTEIRQAGYESNGLNFDSFFTCNELEKLGESDSLNENLKKGPGQDVNGIQVRVAVPLLVDFLNTSDEFLKTGNYNACLRFAHAETMAPFAALLQIASADQVIKHTSKVTAGWKPSEVIPLSANIQWVFYKRSDKPGYMVKVLLNEKEERIDGVDGRTFPYYRWNNLRAFYLAKLKKLNVTLSDNMNAYLTNLK